jgi:hypothetical protein
MILHGTEPQQMCHTIAAVPPALPERCGGVEGVL